MKFPMLKKIAADVAEAAPRKGTDEKAGSPSFDKKQALKDFAMPDMSEAKFRIAEHRGLGMNDMWEISMSLPVSVEFLKAKSNDFKMSEFAKFTSSDPIEILALLANQELEKRTGMKFRRPSISTVDLQRQRAKGGMKTVSMYWEVGDVFTAYALGVDLSQWRGGAEVLPKDQVQKRLADAKAEADKALQLRQDVKDGKLPEDAWPKYMKELEAKGMNYKIAKHHKLAASFPALAKILGQADVSVASKKSDVIEYIKQQINIDITPFIDEKWSKKNYLNLDWDKIPAASQRAIQQLAHAQKKYRLEENGGLGKALFFL